MRYDAFISYNHAADGALAPALQDALQHLAKPWYRRRAMAVFHDETNLSASPELFGAIEDALNESSYYLLLASPGSARSAWVGREIQFWLATKTAATLRIVLVLTEGELTWDKAANCFDPDRSNALHPSLLHAFTTEPLHVDLREAHAAVSGEDAAGPRNFRRLFRHPVAKIAARIRGVDPDTLEGEDLRQHRRTLRVAWSAAIALLVLTVASGWGFVTAQRNADEARAQTKTAQAGELAARSQSLLATDPSQGLAVAVAGVDRASTLLARNALSDAAALPVVGVFGPLRSAVASEERPVAVSADGHRVATTDGANRVAVWNVDHTGAPALLRQPGAIGVSSLAFSPDGRKLAAAYVVPATGDTVAAPGVVVVWDLDRRARVATANWEQYPSSIAFAADGVTLVAGDGRHAELQVWNTATDTHQMSSPPVNLGGVLGVAISPDGRRFATTMGEYDVVEADLGKVVLWDATTLAFDKELPVNGTNVYAGAFSPDGSSFATGDQDGHVEIWDVETGRQLNSWTDPNQVRFVAFDPSGTSIASGDVDGSVVVRNVRTGDEIAKWNDGATVTGLAFPDRGHAVLTGDDQGRAVLRDVRQLATDTPLHAKVLQLAFNHDGSVITGVTASASDQPFNQVVEWDVRNGASRVTDPGSQFSRMAFSADGSTIVTSTLDASGQSTEVQVTRARDGASVGTWTVDGAVDGVATSPDGRLTAVDVTSYPVRNTLTVRDSRSGKVVRTVTQASGTTLQPPSQLGPLVALGANGSVATVYGNRFGVVPAGTGRVQYRRASKGISSSTVAASANGRILATIDHPGKQLAEASSVVRLHNATTGVSTIVDLPNLRPTAIALSSDGRTLAIGDVRRTVTLYDTTEHRTVTTFSTAGAVTSLAFSPNGTQLAAGDDVGHVFRWDASAYLAPTKTLVARVCHALRGYRPSKAAWQQVVPYFPYADLCTQ